jgi:hypothetical protein
MSDRHDTAFRQISDNDSFVSSNAGGNAYPEICVFAHLGDVSELKTFKGKMDTGAVWSLMAEHVVKNRWGIERIDANKWVILDDLGMNGVRTMGQIRLKVRLGSCKKWMDVPFQVIPDSYVRNRYDALLSDKILDRSGIMVYNPKGKNES